MSALKIAENIVGLRKKKGVTQDEMASFLGVTKASVSKWENGQSMPDIMMLPQLATYFDVTVDALLGYAYLSMFVPCLAPTSMLPHILPEGYIH